MAHFFEMMRGNIGNEIFRLNEITTVEKKIYKKKIRYEKKTDIFHIGKQIDAFLNRFRLYAILINEIS